METVELSWYEQVKALACGKISRTLNHITGGLTPLYMDNKYGLSRTIHEGTRQAVRKRDGFGCVHCGIGLVEYHHFDPPFVEATAHTVDGIALLCPNCHSSAESVACVKVLPLSLQYHPIFFYP